MLVKKLGKGDYADYQLDGTVLTIGEDSIDVAAVQRDEQVIHTIKDGGDYVATIEVPPRTYHQEIDDSVVLEEGEEEREVTVMVADPLDIGAVSITLWPLKFGKEE